MAGLILPHIRHVTLTGFQPLFDRTIDLKLPAGPFLLLGGNAMGKTTTLQAVVFALAGGAHEDIEIDRRGPMGRQALSRSGGSRKTKPKIQVEFDLGDTRVVVRRGIKTDSVIGLQAGSERPWVP